VIEIFPEATLEDQALSTVPSILGAASALTAPTVPAGKACIASPHL